MHLVFLITLLCPYYTSRSLVIIMISVEEDHYNDLMALTYDMNSSSDSEVELPENFNEVRPRNVMERIHVQPAVAKERGPEIISVPSQPLLAPGQHQASTRRNIGVKIIEPWNDAKEEKLAVECKGKRKLFEEASFNADGLLSQQAVEFLDNQVKKTKCDFKHEVGSADIIIGTRVEASGNGAVKEGNNKKLEDGIGESE